MADIISPHERRPNAFDRFPIVVLVAAAAALLAAGVWMTVDRPAPSALVTDTLRHGEGDGGIAFGQGDADPSIDVDALLGQTSQAMGAVTSVEFELSRTDAPIFIDQFESIALDHLIGQFELPSNAQAAMDVTIQGDARTRIGAIAYDQEVWVSNPVTGKFETLPAGYDIDPSRFFDPTGGWQPLIEHLTDTQLVGIEQRDGDDTYHVRGVASASDVTNITVGLVRDQAIVTELWIDPGTSLVIHLEFTTMFGDQRSKWTLDLRDYGADFTIDPPPLDLRSSVQSSTP